MVRVNFNIKYNADDLTEAVKFGSELIADFLEIKPEEVEDRVNVEFKVEMYEYNEGDEQFGKFAITAIGNLKNGAVITPHHSK